ncbi:MAG: hypothetical protein KDI13_11330 [Alphaproteobacteria bacterium]|nr:hypothetical protein [Alphaproteobacteria bacterium]
MNRSKRLLFAIAATAMLVACSTQGKVYSQLAQSKKTEDAAWNRMFPLVQAECGYSQKTRAKRSEVVQQSQCITKLVNQHIMPYAAFPSALVEMRANSEANAQRYADGKITGEQYDEYADINYEMYRNNQQAMADSMMATAAQKDQTMAILAGGLAQGASNAAEQRRETYRQQQANRPIQTNCSQDYFGNVHCTTY